MQKTAGLLVLFLLVLAADIAFPADVPAEEPPGLAGYSSTQAMELGARMYREGVLPSGEHLHAVVQGDIPVSGKMFTCANCHLRSGLGTIEGTIITPPTNGADLYEMLHAGPKMTPLNRERLRTEFRGRDRRTAYTDETVARALWEGVDPSGRILDPAMPRYLLNKNDMSLLVFYLRRLSAEYSPGVTDSEIHFATVISEGVDPADRAAMLEPLEAYIRDRNSQTRHQEKRARGAPFYRQESYTAYRRLVLHVWELKGNRDTWEDQLNRYYAETPVFALLGGIASGDWAPVHRFCERHGVPAILPVTDFPVISRDDWYTLYFSKGFYGEGEAAARFLCGKRNGGAPVDIRMFYRSDAAGKALSQPFDSICNKAGSARIQTTEIPPGREVEPAEWAELLASGPADVLVLWLSPRDIDSIAANLPETSLPRTIMVSSTLLGDRLDGIPDSLKSRALVTYPYRLAEEEKSLNAFVERWLRTRKIEVTNFRVQAKMYFLGWLLTDALTHMKGDFYRDYFLDIIDMMRDQTYAITVYPRLSFGPGQRYASKGCYIMKLTEEADTPLVPVSDWVIF